MPAPSRHWRATLAIIGIPLLIALLLFGIGAYLDFASATLPRLQGAPVAVRVDGADRVLLITRQQRTGFTWGRNSRRGSERYFVHEIWSFDAATAQPLWHRRLPLPRQSTSAAPLGSDDGLLWLHANTGLLGVSTRDGAVVADHAAIEAKNPALRGLLPTEQRWYQLDRGLVFTAADARIHRLDARSLRALQIENVDAEPQWDEDTQPVAYWTPTATYVFQKGGLVRGDQWFGLLAPEEAEVYRTRESLPSDRASSDKRVRLYRAQTREVSNEPANWPKDFGGDWGKRKVMSGLAPLPVKTDYLDGGLLSGGSSNSPPLRASDPDSLLILHRDRLGEAGKLQITRVDFAGNQIWNAPLPLSILQCVMRFDQRRILLFGRAYTPNPDQRLRDPYHDAQEWLLSLDLHDGELHGYNLARRQPLEPGAPAAP